MTKTIASSTVYKTYKTYKTYKPKIIRATSSGLESEVLDIVCKTKEEAIVKAAREIQNRLYK